MPRMDAGATVQKARLTVVDGSEHPGGATTLEFMFNPDQLKVTAEAQIHQPTQGGTGGAAKAQPQGAKPRKLTISGLVFDGWHTNQNRLQTVVKTLVQWTRPTDASIQRNEPKPPTVMLVWGASTGRMIIGSVPEYFKMYITSINYTYTMFDADGTPVRLKVDIAGQEIPEPAPAQNPTSGSRVVHRTHVVSEGDSLASIAYAQYRRPTYWRGLAVANGIDDPMRLPLGSTVYVPPINEAAERS